MNITLIDSIKPAYQPQRSQLSAIGLTRIQFGAKGSRDELVKLPPKALHPAAFQPQPDTSHLPTQPISNLLGQIGNLRYPFMDNTRLIGEDFSLESMQRAFNGLKEEAIGLLGAGTVRLVFELKENRVLKIAEKGGFFESRAHNPAIDLPIEEMGTMQDPETKREFSYLICPKATTVKKYPSTDKAIQNGGVAEEDALALLRHILDLDFAWQDFTETNAGYYNGRVYLIDEEDIKPRKKTRLSISRFIPWLQGYRANP